MSASGSSRSASLGVSASAYDQRAPGQRSAHQIEDERLLAVQATRR